jgi:3-hydroxyisobutyrate dehydrogenase
MRIAVLGLGNMGQAFAGRALERGHDVRVWNRTAGRAAELVASGASEAPSAAAAVSDAEAVLTVVADDGALEAVCLGPDGALAALAPGAVLANVSTVLPDTVRRLAEVGSPGSVLDAPMLGAPTMVAAGQGQFLIGGPAESVARLEPLWRDLAASHVHCGPVGSGATMKLVSNLQLIVGVATLAEGIATARANGLHDDLIRAVFGNSPVVSLAGAVRLDSLLDGSHPGWFPPVLARKDLRLAIAVAEQAGLTTSIGPAAEQLLTEVIDTGHEWPDFTAVIEALER